MGVDLVLLSVGGVQRLISESRSTADVAGASRIVEGLARCAARVVARRIPQTGSRGLVFPQRVDLDGISNKVVFLTDRGAGASVAREVAVAVEEEWRRLVAQAFHPRAAPATPGMPDVAWVSVAGGDGGDGGDGYRHLWQAAQEEMVARRRARVFTPPAITGRDLCAQSAGLPAVEAPPHSAPHERKERLSAAGWTKRRSQDLRFPSTMAVASRAFRVRVAAVPGVDEAVARLVAAVDRSGLPGRWDRGESGLDGLGEWVYPQVWDRVGLAREYRVEPDEAAVVEGRAAASALVGVAKDAGIPPPSSYLAVVVQDVDRLGAALGGLGSAAQRSVSGQLAALGERQRTAMRTDHPLAVPVYAGGDDLLAFCPAAAALDLARAIRRQVDALADGPLGTAGPDGKPVSASTAVVYAHMSSPLQGALAAARSALHAAKSATGGRGRSRDALAVVVRTRGGERGATVQPWTARNAGGVDAVTLLQQVRPSADVGELSAGLVSDLERDGDALAELYAEERCRSLLLAELRRLVERQGGCSEAADALYNLGRNERHADRPVFRPVPAALVARFVSREAR